MRTRIAVIRTIGHIKNNLKLNLQNPRASGNEENMTDLPLMEVQEINLDDKQRNQWKERLQKSINQPGRENSYDKRVKIVDKIDVWSINNLE